MKRELSILAFLMAAGTAGGQDTVAEVRIVLDSLGQMSSPQFIDGGDIAYKKQSKVTVVCGGVVLDRRQDTTFQSTAANTVTVSLLQLTDDEYFFLRDTNGYSLPRVNQTVVGNNPHYYFLLSTGSSGSWRLKGLMSHPGRGQIVGEQSAFDMLTQVANMIDTPGQKPVDLLESKSVCQGSASVKALLKFNNIDIINIKSDSSSYVIACSHEYNYITSKDIKSGRMNPIPGNAERTITLDRTHDNIPIKDVMVVKLSDGSTFTNTATRTIKTLTDTRYEDEWELVEGRTSQVDRVGQTTRGKRTVQLGDVPLEKFYISAYGLPEPQGLGVPDFAGDKRRRRLIYAGVAVAATLAVALIVRMRLRRRGVAS